MSQNATASNPGFSLRALWISFRPYQWVKNTLIFCGLIFSEELFVLERIGESLAAFALFCCASSAIYLFNDTNDVEEDRLHPVKRLRPIASGTLSIRAAHLAMFALMAIAVSCSAFMSKSFCGLVTLYLALNFAYTWRIKQIPVLDVMTIGAGFMLRVMAGIIVVGLTPSPWVVLCTMMLALFVGFGKRRHELSSLGEVNALKHRSSLIGYSVGFLDTMMGVSAATAVVTYALFTVSDEMVTRFQNGLLVFTTPLVTYAIFRYLFLIYHDKGGQPARLFLSDRPLVAIGATWFVMAAAIVNAPVGLLPWWATAASEQEIRRAEQIEGLQKRIEQLELQLSIQEKQKPAPAPSD